MGILEGNYKELQGGERIYPKFFNEASHDHKERYQLAINYIKSGDRVLDAASGAGYGSYYMAANSGCELVVGLDVNDHALDWAKTYFSTPKNQYINVDLLGDFDTKLPIKEFDVITCFETIEHLSEDGNFLKKINSLLKPGGILLISSPNEDVIPCDQNPFYKDGKNPHHYRHYTPQQLKNALSESGFSVVDNFTQCPNNMVRGENGFVIVYVCTNAQVEGQNQMDSVDKGIEKLNLLKMRKLFPFLSTKASNSTDLTRIDERINEIILSYEQLMTAFNIIDEGNLDESLTILESIDKSLCPESYFWIGLISQTNRDYFHAIEMYSKVLDNKNRLSHIVVKFAKEQLDKTLKLI
ncbi:class I SAM-dependent methyltransferase [Metabacillus halosaccharovorans]|uniref:class I SAM-dependent methyltransferase n=1 Tax=Metabacillus halosaccharovorans TaxID=930124 RepID=UPI0014727A25|nr:class I SAM-dependent methyltransferase [Metabacillus halosaccharovorans]